MKICQVAPYFPYREHINGYPVGEGYHIGGVERHTYHVAENLSKLRHEVTILTTKSPRHRYFSEIDMDVDVIRVPIDVRVYNSCISSRILKCLNPEEFDVIHAHTPVPLAADFAAVKSFKKRPFVLTYHNDIDKEGAFGKAISKLYNATLGNFLLSHADVIIATTKGYAKDSMQLSKYLEKVRIIPNGVDTEIFHTKLDRQKMRKKYGLDDAAKVILFVGRLDYYKGCHHLIEAFYKISKDMQAAHLILVGRGPLERSLRNQIKKKGMSSKVFLAGYVSDNDLPYYYAASDLSVLPSVSFQEGFGLVQLEALACGKPVVTTGLPGVAEIDPDGTCSIHVPPRNEKSLANAMRYLLKGNQVREEMAKNAREKALNYSWKNIVEDIEVLYYETIQQGLE